MADRSWVIGRPRGLDRLGFGAVFPAFSPLATASEGDVAGFLVVTRWSQPL
jgi:hypothetical protein